RQMCIRDRLPRGSARIGSSMGASTKSSLQLVAVRWVRMGWFNPPLHRPGNKSCPKCGQPQGLGLLRTRVVQTCSRCGSSLTLDLRRLAAFPVLLIVIGACSIALVVLVDSPLFTSIGLLALLATAWFALAWLASWRLKSTPELPEDATKTSDTAGVIRISRREEHRDSLRPYRVVLDGRVVADIWEGQTIDVDAQPGDHLLHLKIDWCRSNIVRLQVGKERIDFECGSSLRGTRIVLAMLYVTVLWNRYIWLRRTPQLA
ncbi:MAG: hypothetical protein QUS33_12610, partial [Dehalococcoidia bacterium]|nr:hypothetical protein [Dehalococcoidia bacterium]